MLASLFFMSGNGALPTVGTHPHDYYWRAGMELRPAPSRLRFDSMWTQSRRDILEPWMDFHEVPGRRTAPGCWRITCGRATN